MASNKGSRVCVVVRLRPSVAVSKVKGKDKDDGTQEPCVKAINDKSLEIWNWRNAEQSLRFEFDAFFGAKSQQKSIFSRSVRPLLHHTLEGQNVSVFAYGPTGAGKTYTMQGSSAQPGIIPRSLYMLFREITKREADPGSDWKHSVSFSYLEIYQEKVYDLLEVKGHDLPIREDQHRNIFIPNLAEKEISSVQEFQSLFQPANQNRTTAATKLNSRSSRSHSVLLVRVKRVKETDSEKKTQVGKLYLIDLAGSENNKKTGNEGIRLKESGSINMSLFQLGKVVDALNQGLPRIPYRDSKLTRLLQDSLGGHAHALMLTNIAPEKSLYMDTYTTLNFAAKSRNVVNKPFVREISEVKVPARKRSTSADRKGGAKRPRLDVKDRKEGEEQKPKPAPLIGFSPLIKRQASFEENVKLRLDNLEQNLLSQLSKVTTARPKAEKGLQSGAQRELKRGFEHVKRLHREIASVKKVLHDTHNRSAGSRTPPLHSNHTPTPLTSCENLQDRQKKREDNPSGKIQFAKVKSAGISTSKENLSAIKLDPEFRVKHVAAILHLLNTGTVKQLKSLQSVGEKRAQLIHNWRQMFGEFQAVEDLYRVTGLPQKTVNAIIQGTTNTQEERVAIQVKSRKDNMAYCVLNNLISASV